MYNTIITYIGIHYSAHWQMVVILPKENLVVWFCSLHNRLDNNLKGIINRSVLFFNTFALGLVSNINILVFLVFNSVRWIVVKLSDLDNAYTYTYFMSV